MMAVKCWFLVILLLSTSIDPSWSSCPAPPAVKDGAVHVLPAFKKRPDGAYPENAQAKVECNPGFKLEQPNYEFQLCVKGEWKSSVHSDGATCVPIQCGPPPKIEHGYFTVEKTRFKSTDRAGETFPVGMTVEPACEKSYFLNCSHQCGRIICDADGTWKPRDGKFISECVAEPLRSNLSNSDDDRGTGSETTLKHYLIIALAVICIMIVVAVLVLLLRRPSFCKKQNSNGASGRGGMGSNMGRVEEPPVIITSSSPIPGSLDLPVAMNTGIFVPGGNYDWTECRFQESPLCGTSAFK